MAYTTKKETDSVRKQLEKAKVKDCYTYLKSELQNIYTEEDEEKKARVCSLINVYIDWAYGDMIKGIVSGLRDEILRSGEIPGEVEDFAEFEKWYSTQMRGNNEDILLRMINDKSQARCFALYDDIRDKIMTLDTYAEKVLKKRIDDLQSEMDGQAGSYLMEDTKTNNQITLVGVTELISQIDSVKKNIEESYRLAGVG